MEIEIKAMRIAVLPATLAVLAVLFLGGCRHTVTFNDNIIYTPVPAIRDGVLQDPSLQGCLNQALERVEGEEVDLTSITLLACPGAGVTTLAGIGALTQLEQLELSDNGISNLSPLAELRNLRVLGIRNNAVGDLRPLNNLALLRFVSLEGNNRIPCGQLDTLQARLGNTLTRPAACID